MKVRIKHKTCFTRGSPRKLGTEGPNWDAWAQRKSGLNDAISALNTIQRPAAHLAACAALAGGLISSAQI
jgi:hypothetical protein